MPPPFVPTLWGGGGGVAGGVATDFDCDSDSEEELNGEQHFNVMNFLQCGPPDSRNPTQNYHNRKYE